MTESDISESIKNDVDNSPINTAWDSNSFFYGSFISSDNALSFDLENFFPYYIFVEKASETSIEYAVNKMCSNLVPSGKITFFNKDDEPIYKDEASPTKWKWFKLDRYELGPLGEHLDQRMPDEVVKNGVAGWKIPLYESEDLQSMEDANVYLHNLMRWESMLAPEETGPIMQRFAWIVQRIYANVYKEQHKKTQIQDQEFTQKRMKAISIKLSITSSDVINMSNNTNEK